MFKIKHIKRKLLFKWFISYLTMLLIAISIISVIYYKGEVTINHEINKANNLHLSKIQRAGDLRLMDMNNISTLISMDKRVAALTGVQKKFRPENQMDIIAVRDFLNTIQISNSFIDQIYIYFKNTNSAVSNFTHIDSQLSYKLYNGEKALSYGKWLDFLYKRHDGVFTNSLSLNLDGNNSTDSISYIQSIPMDLLNYFSANVVVQSRRNHFDDLLKSVARPGENIILMKSGGEVVSSTLNPVSYDFGRYFFSENTGSFYDVIDSEKMFISYIRSEVPGFRYISVIPKSVYLEKIINARSLVLLLSLMFIVFGGLAVQYIVRKDYNPIKNILESISKNLGLPMEIQKDELTFIQSVFNNTIDENDKIMKKMRENENVVRSSFLESLLKGRIDERMLTEKALKEFGISFTSNSFAVMLITLDNNEARNSSVQEAGEIELSHFIITNVVEELVNQANSGLMADLDHSTLACIINVRNPERDTGLFKREIIEAVEKAQNFISEHFKLQFSASVSNVYSNLNGIPFAYKEALIAMNHKAFMSLGKGNVILYDEIANLGSLYKYSAETEYRLTNVIKEGNFARAKEIVDGIFESNFSNQSLNAETGKCLVFDLLATLIKTVDNPEALDQLQPISRLSNCRSLQQMNVEIISLLQFICDYFQQKNKVQSEYRLGRAIMDYIEMNYQNENLNVAMIGDFFGMTSNYLSRMFKTQVGEGLHDYIEKIRVDKAEDLIRSEKINVSEVAAKVGYSSSKTFIRVFKKLKGTTPGKFREIE